MSYYRKMKRKPEKKPIKIQLTSYTHNIVSVMEKADIIVERKGFYTNSVQS